MNLISFLFPQVIAKYISEINGDIYIKEIFGRKFVEVGGLMQSGRLVDNLFLKGLPKLKLKKNDPYIKHILLLGLGGGTGLRILMKFFPDATISVVEIDPVMGEIAQKHFGYEFGKKIKLIIGDVFDNNTQLGDNFDLIVVDLFVGYEIPQKLLEEKYLKKLKSKLTRNGMMIFNRLYFQKYKNEADQFLDKVKVIFEDVKVVKVYFNILIACT